MISGAAATTCGGTASTGASSVTLTGGSIPGNGSCTITVPVSAANGGTYIDSIAAGALQTSNGNNAAPAVATLTVNAAVVPPTIGKAFSPAVIDAGGTASLTITLSNASATAASLSSPLVDTLPDGVVTAGAASNTCGGTSTAGTSTVTLAGGSIPTNGSCTITVLVTAANGGSFIDSIAAGALQTNNGNNAAPAVATLTVNAAVVAPTIGKAFSPATIDAGGTSTLTITLSNADATAASLRSPLVDTLPSGVVTAGSASNTCGGTSTSGASTVTLTGGSIPGSGSCTITVLVTAADGGSFINSIAAGALQTSNGNNLAPAIATLTVNSAAVPTPTIGKAFNPATINAGGNSTLTITLSNTSGTAASLSAPLVDTLPSGVVTAGAALNTCGGSSTETSSTVTLTGGSIPANGSCTITVLVSAANGGNFINSIAAGALQTSNGNNAGPAIATLTVNAAVIAPTLGKAFSPATISAGGTSTLTITLSNADAAAANLTEPLVDTLPSGLVTAGAATNTCGGTSTAGTSTVTLTGGSIPANGSCTVTVLVSAASGGNFINGLAAGALQTSNGNNAGPAISTLTVVSVNIVPTLGKAFNPATINAGGNSTLTITLSNTNSGVVTAGAATNTCGGISTVGTSTVTLTGGSIPANGSCTITVLVTAPISGNFINTLIAGALQTNKGNSASAVVATLTVVAANIAPTLEKDFSPHLINVRGISTLTITMNNPNSTVASLTAPLIDNLPHDVRVYGNAENTCGGIVTADKGSSTVTLTGGSIPANGSCTVTVDVTSKYEGRYHNKIQAGALQTSKGSNAAEAVATLKVRCLGKECREGR